MLETLSTEQLKTFVTIAETGSYTEAAERLFRSQPAVSLQIKRLEGQLGAKLFERTGRVSNLTEAGRVLHGYASQILELNEEALARLSMTEASGTVRVGVLEEVAHGSLVRLLTRFGRLAGEIRIELEVSTSWELVKRIQTNELCLAIANTAYTDLPAEPLWDEAYLWAKAEDASFPDTEPIPLITDPADSPCIGTCGAVDALRASGKPFQVVFQTMSLLATQAAVRAGLGVGIIAESAVTDDMELLEAADGFPGVEPAHIGLYRGTEASGEAASSLHEFLVAHLHQGSR